MYSCQSHYESYLQETYRVRPTVEQLFGYAVEQIRVAASELWPDERLRLVEHVPSVTGYVHRAEVGGRTLFAKYSYLGSSLVSVLRGRHGDWDRVRAKQRAYVVVPGSLLEREAGQLRLLHKLGRPRAHRVAAFRRGVLFTESVNSATLAQLLCAEPLRTAELLGRTWAELRELHRPEVVQRFARSAEIEERSIPVTFTRKFASTAANIDPLPAALAPLVAVARLSRMWATASGTGSLALVYGDLKPEHVLFQHHAVASDRPVFLDPGMSCARVTVDAAKLVSRIVLLLTDVRSCSSQVIADGLAAFVDDQTQVLSAAARREWFYELVLLWLMDTVNILSSYLAAPAGLPLPAHAMAAFLRCGPWGRWWTRSAPSSRRRATRIRLPRLDPEETRCLEAADVKLHIACAALAEQLHL